MAKCRQNAGQALQGDESRIMKGIRIGVVLLLIAGSFAAVRGQTAPVQDSSTAATPQDLATLVLARFATGSAESFNAVDPDALSRAVVQAAIQRKATRQSNLGRVVWSSPQRAVLLLTGTVVDPDSAVETIRSRHFSGFYEAVKQGDAWSLSKQLPFDEGNRILSHEINATIVPGVRIDVEDTMQIDAGGQYGFAIRLNDQTHMEQVQLNGADVHYDFGGGVLWIATPASAKSRLSLKYSLTEVRQDAEHEKAQPRTDPPAPPTYGSFVNETVWSPVFDFDSANGNSTIDITLRIPATYYVTTSVSQTETVKDGVRIVHGHTIEPEFILSLIYDRDWRPTQTQIGNMQFGTFLTPDFHFTPEVLGEQVRKVDDILSKRFGAPQSNYIAIAEERDVGHHGFVYRTNDLVVSGQGGSTVLFSPLSEAASQPNAPLAHEVSHGWTMQATGPGANFLREGWATFCEWSFVAKQYGPDVEKGIWQTAYNYYILGGHDGVRSIVGNPDNGSIHYVKGAWIFHMLEETMGQNAFDEGMKNYIQIPRDQKAGYEEFIAAMSKAAGHDMSSFITPWITAKYIPNLQARIEGSRIVVTQQQPDVVFEIPVQLGITTSSGATVVRTIQLSGKTSTLDVVSLGDIRDVRIDPDNELLLRRSRGETVTFTLHNNAAKTVALEGSFTLKPVSATQAGDVWTVAIPMTQGQYSWDWQIDGKKAEAAASGAEQTSGVRIVEPLQDVQNAYPR
jgi:hypothetical protein